MAMPPIAPSCSGLAGHAPDSVDPDEAARLLEQTDAHAQPEPARAPCDSVRSRALDLVIDRVTPAPRHPNTMAFLALDADGQAIAAERWCSIGGGFVVHEAEVGRQEGAPAIPVPHPFRSAADLLDEGARTGLTIADMIRANEEAARRPRRCARICTA